MNIKKIAFGTAATALMFGSLAIPAFAAVGGDASACGAVHGAFAPLNGGNFGWLGPEGGTPGYHDAVGQQPGATGFNNSSTDCQQ